jgi:hypothetical protein
MDTTCVQDVGTLYQTRSLCFCDLFRDQYMDAFALEGGASILELVCGPGALCKSQGQQLLPLYPGAGPEPRLCGRRL